MARTRETADPNDRTLAQTVGQQAQQLARDWDAMAAQSRREREAAQSGAGQAPAAPAGRG
jgi:hypothetical protein